MFDRLLTRWARPALAVYWPVLAVATHWPKLDLGQQIITFHGMDKLLHVACFALLTVLLVHALGIGRAACLDASLATGVVIAAVYAIADELTQGLTQRTVSAFDLMADWVGVFGAAAAMWWGLPRGGVPS
jgi:VanZ family protein